VAEQPSITDQILDKITARLGASSETLHKVKFGRGTVGKVAIIAVASLTAIGAATFHLEGTNALIGIGALVLITFAVLGIILYVVVARPELAVLEGTELLMYKQITLGIKDNPQIANSSDPPVLPVPIDRPQLSGDKDEQKDIS
jgi:hypothetical protein